MTLLAAGALTVGSALFYGAYQYLKPQGYENQHLNDVIAASTALGETLCTSNPKLLEPIDSLSLGRIEQLALFLLEVEDPQLKDQATQFLSALNTYRTNLDRFIDQEVPGATTYEKYLSAKKQYELHPDDKHEFRLHCFEHRLETERLSMGISSEEGAYTKVVQTKEQLRLAKLYFGSKGSPVLKDKLTQNAKAVDKHYKIVKQWRKEQPGSDIDVYKKTLKEKDRAEDPFIWEGRCKALKIPSDILKVRLERLSSNISSLEGRISAIDPSLIGKSQGLIRRIYNSVASFFSSGTTIVNSLVSAYNTMKAKYEKLTNTSQVDSPEEAPPVTKTPQEQLISFFMLNMRNFDDRVKGFIDRHLKVPEDAQIQIEGNTVTITLPKTVSAGPIDQEQSLSPEEFQILNRQAETENLTLLQGKAISSTQAPSNNPKIKNLVYFRSLGPSPTKSLIGGAKLSMGKKVKLKIDGNKIEFLEGGPQVGSGWKKASVTAMTLHPLEDSVAEKELGKVEVQSKTMGVPLPSGEYFLADLERLLSRM